jgi:hypothetical protein
MLLHPPALYLCCLIGCVRASVTVWSQIPLGGPTGSAAAAAANYTAPAAFDPTVLTPPAIPNPAPPNMFSLQLFSSNTSQRGLSIVHKGTFYGFSIEMSVMSQVREYKLACFLRLLKHCYLLIVQLGSIRESKYPWCNEWPCNISFSSFIQVSFLNLMANIKQRGGGVSVRIG